MGCALMVHTAAAPGCEGGQLAERGCLSCQKWRGAKNDDEVFLALEENHRRKAAERDLQGASMSHKGVYFKSSYW